jgi:MFS family permease
MAVGTAPSGRRALWRVPGYGQWFAGDTLTELGRAISVTAIPLVVLAISGSPVVTGLTQGAMMIASVLVRLPAGLLVDAVDRRRIVYVASGLVVVLYGTLTALLAMGVVNTVALIVILPLASAALTVSGAAVDAILKSILPSHLFPHASSLEEGRGAAISLAGGPLGGLLYSLSQWVPFATTVLGHVVTLFTVRRIPGDLHPSRNRPRGPRGPRHALVNILAGFRVVLVVPALPVLIAAVTLGNLAFTGLTAAIIYTWQLDGVPPVVIGLLATAAGVSVLLGSLFAGNVATARRGYLTASLSLIICTLGAMSLAVVDTVWAIVLLIGVTCLPFPFINALVGGYSAAVIPNHYQGRVGAASAFLGSLAAPLGPVLAGLGVEFWGLGWTAAGAAVLLGTAAVLCLGSRALRSLPAADEWSEVDLSTMERPGES